MKIEFLLKATKNYDGSLRVCEYYQATGAELVLGVDGKPRPAFQKYDRVDQEIQKVHEKAYKAFSDFYQANQAALNDECREHPEVDINVTERMAIAAQAASQASPENSPGA